MFGLHLSEPKVKETMFNSIEEAIEDIKAGKIIIVVDDEDRENEGDFVCAAACVTPEIINFMATYGRGLICTPIEEQRADELNLPMMVRENTAFHETAFTVSIDLLGQGCTTGISAHDRSTGIKALVNPETKPSDFARPGHIFPLRAKSGGVLRRTGHTEAAIDLAQLAGYYPAGVLVEILNKDGSMARLPQLLEIGAQHNLKTISIKDLVEYRMKKERLVEKQLEQKMPTKYGELELIAFKQINTNDTHLAIKKGDWTEEETVMVRVHSSSETGDIIGNLLEDNGAQIQKALGKISAEGKGLLLYMRHAEKEDAILNWLKNYKNEQVGIAVEKSRTESVLQRDFGVGAQILRDLGIRKIKLLTNNPKRRIGLKGYGLEIMETLSLDE